jgi:hypothetical protein
MTEIGEAVVGPMSGIISAAKINHAAAINQASYALGARSILFKLSLTALFDSTICLRNPSASAIPIRSKPDINNEPGTLSSAAKIAGFNRRSGVKDRVPTLWIFHPIHTA